MEPISDSDLADVEMIAAEGRALPAIVVRAIVVRLRQAEARAAAHQETARTLVAA